MIKRALALDNAMNIIASVFINDDAGPGAGCTTAPAKFASGKPLSRAKRGYNADAHLKRQVVVALSVSYSLVNAVVSGYVHNLAMGLYWGALPNCDVSGIIGERSRIAHSLWIWARFIDS